MEALETNGTLTTGPGTIFTGNGTTAAFVSLFGVVDHPGAAVLEHEGGCGAVPEDFPGGAGVQAERLGVGEGFAGDGDVYSAELEHGAASPVAVEHRFGLPGGCDHEHQHVGIGGRVADRGSRLDAVRRQGHGFL